MLAATIPVDLAATGQAIYGTVGIGVANVVLTLVSGWLIAWIGYASFIVMALLCLAALPVISTLAARLRVPYAAA